MKLHLVVHRSKKKANIYIYIYIEKYLFKFINNAVFGKTVENVTKRKDIKLVTTKRRRNCLASEPSYHTTRFFTEHLLAIEIKRIRNTCQ